MDYSIYDFIAVFTLEKQYEMVKVDYILTYKYIVSLANVSSLNKLLLYRERERKKT